jgi:hypothetical protein
MQREEEEEAGDAKRQCVAARGDGGGADDAAPLPASLLSWVQGQLERAAQEARGCHDVTVACVQPG